MHVYAPHVSMPGVLRRQKMSELELQMVVRYHVGWKLNPGPLQERPVLSTTKPSLQNPQTSCFLVWFWFLVLFLVLL